MINGYIEVLPPGYNPAGSTLYPLIIFLAGQNEFGNGSPAELPKLYGQNSGMLPQLVRDGQVSNSYGAGGATHFIMIMPQIREQIKNGRPPEAQRLSPNEVNDVINYALQNYKVDVNRIYLTGLSLGGGSTWNYPGQDVNYGNRLAAIVPFAGASKLSENPLRDDNIAAANLPVWTFVVNSDEPYRTNAEEYVNAINLIHPNQAMMTTFIGGDHIDAWKKPLEGSGTGSLTYPDLYEWLLTKQRSLAQPVFSAVNAGPDQTVDLQNGSMLFGTNSLSFNGATAPLDGTTSIIPAGSTVKWVKVDGNGGGTITDPNALNTTVTNLKPGSYTFQLRVTDNTGLITTVDNKNIVVNKPPENKYHRIEAESSISLSSGIVVEKTYLDEGAAYGLGFLSPTRFMEYTLSGITPGTYSLYMRYLSTFGDPPVQVIVDNSTTYNVNLTSNGNNWATSNKIDIHLLANSTIRFVSTKDEWNFNYFELALVAADAPLPVKFVYFNAHCKNGAVSIQWKTALEQNSSRFSVQRSTDGTSWSEIGSVAAAGQSTQEKSYVFVDKAPSSSAGMYRVVEYDYTGDKTISSIVRSNCSGRSEISLYPNPSSGNSALSISLERSASITVQVVDAKGSMVWQKQVLLPAGSNTLPLNMTGYPDGVYTINVHYNGERKSLKLIKK